MAQSWYNRLTNWNVESLFARAPPPRTKRSIFVNETLPNDYFDQKGRPKKDHVYITNQVVTSKYTIITFLPRNLLEQFRRVANVVFLVIDILQFFPRFSTISPGLVILPLIIVLGVTGVKDAYEDIKRHQGDRRVNHSETLVLDGGDWVNPNRMGKKSKTFVRGILSQAKKLTPKDRTQNAEEGAQETDMEYDTDNESHPRTPSGHSRHSWHSHKHHKPPHWKRALWEDIRVGDFVKIRNDENVPADILICATSEEENVAFVETKNLDGETNLKSRNAVASLTSLRNAPACARADGFNVDCEAPDVNMYRLNAAVVTKNGTYPVVLQNTLLRGTILRHTRWVIGIVMFTGEDTKITLNSGATPSKLSRVERQMNPQVFINLAILLIMSTVCGIVDSLIEQDKFPEGAPWLARDDRSDDNPKINGLITLINGLITFQNIIPISLYLSIEFVRTCQAAFIYFDHQIYYEKNGQPTLARSWNLSDDLGQIQYVFSDKTGTLTQNVMVFRACSVAGRLYKGDPERSTDTVEEKPLVQEKPATNIPSTSSNPSDSSQTTPDVLSVSKVELAEHVLAHFHDSSLEADIQRSAESDADQAFSRSLNGFFSVLALCHTVLATVDPVTHAVEYKAQSPDEAALVQAAADVGYVFRGKDREIMKLQTPFTDGVEEYELLNVLDFTSARKRMSIVVRKLGDEDGQHRVFLLSKGADNVIFERLRKDESQEFKTTTQRDLDEFASDGLRTLCLAYKVIPDSIYEEWATRYHNATIALHHREELVDEVSAELEQDLRLLGATAIEDKLQDGVPDTIADLKRAGIKVWVLTGDKLETAIAIGYSTNLVARDSNLIVVRGGEAGERYSVGEQMLEAVEQFFPDCGILETLAAKGFTEVRSEKQGERPNRRQSTAGWSDLVGTNNGERPGGFILVIDGTALGNALNDSFNKELLLQLALQCEAVICCRVSPLQKALVVKLVKEGLKTITLAIGDGANDVSMIQAADVGVGIRGEEGLQAVNSSDYAISQFRFLKRLLLVHGHWSYARNGTMIINFFYKNIICIGVLWWFQIYCAWSTQYVFEYTYVLFWNVFWTLCPVIAIGLFDRFIDADILMAIPELYRFGRERSWYSLRLFGIYMFDGFVQSVVVFFIINYAYRSVSARTDGYETYIYEASSAMAISAVTIANTFNGLNTHAWTGWVWFAVSIGTILIWAYTAIYTTISPGWIVTPVFGNYHFLFRSSLFWFSIVLVIFLALLPRYLAKAIRRQYWPTDIDILQEILESQLSSRAGSRLNSYPLQSLHNGGPLTEAASRSVTDMSLGGMQTSHRGFDFASEEGGVHMRRIQSNLSERRRRTMNSQGDGENTHSQGETGLRRALFPSLSRSVRRKMRLPTK
ncbi:phospholipid-translocating ATPase [Hysterangium stoloniferum]|nr:phospholipid-translocating ATPase [Hysterangium stoloniferum]